MTYNHWTLTYNTTNMISDKPSIILVKIVINEKKIKK
jgi:hypothetical protein